MAPTTYELINSSWKSTCKILFGQELGELKEFEDYMKPAAPGQFVTSSVSGKQIWVASDQYSKKSKFFDYGSELEQFNKISSKPVDINKIKDLDSLIESLSEKFVYSGNKVLGNSKFIENSDAIIDSTGVFNSSIVERGKYVAYGYLARENENSFASMSSGQSKYILRCCYNNSLTRCFEVCTTVMASDCYLCYNMLNCTDCLFTFNVRSKRYMVGNVQLDRDKYYAIKTKLMAELAEELKTTKKLDYSIIDLMNKA